MNWVTDREMVDDLPLFGAQTQVSVYFVIKKRPDSSCSKSKSLGRKIHPLTKRTRLEVHVAISAITKGLCGALEITDHGECHAGIPRQVLSKTECCGNKTLITGLF